MLHSIDVTYNGTCGEHLYELAEQVGADVAHDGGNSDDAMKKFRQELDARGWSCDTGADTISIVIG